MDIYQPTEQQLPEATNERGVDVLRSPAGAAAAEAVMGTAFDQALVNHALGEAADHYARQRGSPGSPEYRAAWIRFRSRIRTLDDLERWRTHQRWSGRTSRQRATPIVSSSEFPIETALQPAASAKA